jgi:uncharacterized metal-binding protein
MPSGKAHLRIELVLLPIALAAFGHWISPLLGERYRWHGIVLFGLAYLFSSLLLSPDLDLRHNRTRNRWGVLGFVWIPYTWVFKHRGLSHSLILGPLTRLAYLGLVGTVAALSFWVVERFLVSADWKFPQIDIDAYTYYWLAILIGGLWIPNMIHILVDRVHSALRRR